MLTTNVAERVHRVEDAYVNWYLVEDASGVTVVDAGHPRSWRSLHQALTTIRRGPESVRALVLTHGHFDHVGFAERARRELGVPVYVHDADASLARRPWRYRHQRPRTLYALRHPGFVRRFAAMAGAGALAVKGVTDLRTLAPASSTCPAAPRSSPRPATPGATARCTCPSAGP
jgi:glyoxylase-like metal-dependent hydrolase (beta-lactamase superfamily II)